MEFRECLRWLPDDKPRSTPAVVVVSRCGTVVKRLPYRKWNSQNQGYSDMKEHVYKMSCNRGKQRHDSHDKIARLGLYKSVCIRDMWHSVHVLVAKAFIPNPYGHSSVDHLNGVRDDNRAGNLEWVTNAENIRRSWETGLRNRCALMKLPPEEMQQVLAYRQKGMSFEKIGKLYGMRGESIRHRVKQVEAGFCS